MGATASAPFKALSMTNGNVNRSMGLGSNSGAVSTNTSGMTTNGTTPSARRNRRMNQMMMMGGKSRKARRGTRKSRKGTYRRRR